MNENQQKRRDKLFTKTFDAPEIHPLFSNPSFDPVVPESEGRSAKVKTNLLERNF